MFSAQSGAGNQEGFLSIRRDGLGLSQQRRNLDGSEPRYYLSNAPEDTPLETLCIRGRLPVAH